MNISHNLKRILALCVLNMLIINPIFALDFDAVDNNSSRKKLSTSKPKQVSQPTPTTSSEPVVNEVKPNITQEIPPQTEPMPASIYEKLPNVPKLPEKAYSKSVAPLNTMYTGKTIDKNAITPCNDIKVEELILDKQYLNTKFANTVTPAKQTPAKQKQTIAVNNKYKTILLPKGMQFRVANSSKITDYMRYGQKITFKTTQEMKIQTLTIPANTKFTGVIENSHRPQMACNGGLVTIRLTTAEINGYNQSIDGSVVKLNTEKVRFGNLKGAHTYFKTTCRKAKWGQNKFKEYSKTSSRLADKGAGVIIAPIPYISGCVLACASTISSPITAFFGKGGNLTIPANTIFTIKLNEDTRIRL